MRGQDMQRIILYLRSTAHVPRKHSAMRGSAEKNARGVSRCGGRWEVREVNGQEAFSMRGSVALSGVFSFEPGIGGGVGWDGLCGWRSGYGCGYVGLSVAVLVGWVSTIGTK